VPLAALALPHGGSLWLRALLASPDGAKAVRAEAEAPQGQAEALGTRVAEELLARGGDALLARLAEAAAP
jgi:hydroxymethylbilane synthase